MVVQVALHISMTCFTNMDKISLNYPAWICNRAHDNEWMTCDTCAAFLNKYIEKMDINSISYERQPQGGFNILHTCHLLSYFMGA